METSALHILIVEDEPGHAVAIQRAFAHARAQDTVRTVGSLKEGREAIAAAAPDIVVTDMQLPDGKAFELLNSPDIGENFPVIVMTSYGDETVAVEAMKAGAVDYVVKSPAAFNEMPRTVERVMREWAHVQEVQKARDALAHSRAELRSVFDGTPVMLCLIDSDRRVLTANRAFNDFVSGVSPAVPQERPCGIMGCVRALDDPAGCGYGPSCGECVLRIAMSDTLCTGKPHIDVECEIPIRRNGVEQTVVFLGSITPMPQAEGLPRALVSLLDITERRQAEQKLRESQEQLLSLFNGIDEVVYVSDPETYELIFVNDALKTVFGTPVQGKCYEYLQHRDSPCPFCTNDRIFGPDKGSSYVWEHKNENSDRWYRCIDKAIFWPDGRWVRYEMAIDITERRQAEDTLRSSEGKVTSILDAIEDGVLSYSFPDNRMLYCSPSCSRIFGMDITEEFQNDPKAWACRVHPDDLPMLYDWGMTLDEGSFYDKEFRLVRQDGSVIWVYTSHKFVYDSAGNAVRYDIMLTDITDRKNADIKLRESESSLARSQQMAHIGSWQLDLESKYLMWSDELYCIFGLAPRDCEATYELFCDVIHPDDLARGKAAYEDSIRSDIDFYEIEHRIIRRDNAEVRYVYEHCVHERDANGTIIRSIGMVQDITERKQVEEKAAEHLRELEQWYRVTLNREDRVLELKAEVNKLLERQGEEKKYGKDEL